MGIITVSTARDYTHLQTTPASVWDIDYKMSFVPIVEILIDSANGGFEKMIPQSIERISDHRVKIHFSLPVSGRAHLAG